MPQKEYFEICPVPTDVLMTNNTTTGPIKEQTKTPGPSTINERILTTTVAHSVSTKTLTTATVPIATLTTTTALKTTSRSTTMTKTVITLTVRLFRKNKRDYLL